MEVRTLEGWVRLYKRREYVMFLVYTPTDYIQMVYSDVRLQQIDVGEAFNSELLAAYDMREL